jgi:shikimate dehydrogenase
MHRAAYAGLGLDWTYDAIEVTAGSLSAFVDGLDADWGGLSVTAPLKREAADRATSREDVVEELGVANTLIAHNGRWHAANTDVPGAVNALAERGITSVESVRFLGGGATVDSLRVAARKLGAKHVEVWLRDPSKLPEEAGVTVHHLDDPIERPVDLLISTIPAEFVPAARFVERSSAVFDVVYDPWPTLLTVVAEQAGAPVVTGLDLLAHQAALQVELMTGTSVDPSVLRDAAFGALGHI